MSHLNQHLVVKALFPHAGLCTVMCLFCERLAHTSVYNLPLIQVWVHCRHLCPWCHSIVHCLKRVTMATGTELEHWIDRFTRRLCSSPPHSSGCTLADVATNLPRWCHASPRLDLYTSPHRTPWLMEPATHSSTTLPSATTAYHDLTLTCTSSQRSTTSAM